MDQNVLAGYAAVALALILDPSCGLFSDAARPCRRPAPCAFYLFIRQPMGRKSALRREIPWIPLCADSKGV